MSSTSLHEEVCRAMAGKGKHDIKAHLRAIIQFTGLVREDLDPEDPQHAAWQKHLQISDTSALLLVDLIDRLTSLIETEQREAREAVVFPALPVIHAQAAQFEVSVTDVTGSEDAACSGDPAMFTRAMAECFDNVAKYGGKEASVHLNETAEGVVIDILDAGPGLVKEQHETAFELFRRFVPVYNPPGAGLGFPIALAALRKMGGNMQLVESTEPEAGLRLRIHVSTLRQPPHSNTA